MKILNLLMWVGQFGFSVIFPTIFVLYLAVLLMNKFGLGLWILIPFAIVGILTSVRTTRACLHSLRKAAEEASGEKDLPISFNSHS